MHCVIYTCPEMQRCRSVNTEIRVNLDFILAHIVSFYLKSPSWGEVQSTCSCELCCQPNKSKPPCTARFISCAVFQRLPTRATDAVQFTNCQLVSHKFRHVLKLTLFNRTVVQNAKPFCILLWCARCAEYP